MTLVDYDYQLVVDNAHEYARFQVDASHFKHDVHIALSMFEEQIMFDNEKFEIVIGGYYGEMSIIRTRTGWNDYTNFVEKSHTEAYFDNFKSDIEVVVIDGQLIVKTKGETFMEYKDASFEKNKYNYLFASGFIGGFGTIQITGFPDNHVSQSTRQTSI